MQNGDRKRSTDSDKSLSSLSAIISDSKSQPKDIVILQKKMKVLRDAVIKERQSKETIVKSKNDLALEVERLRAQVLEKDAFLLKLRNDNADLHDKLTIQRKKAENFAQQSGDGNMNISGVLGGIFGAAKKGQNEEFQKLQTEHNYLRKQLEVVLEKLTKSEELLDQSKRENKHQIDSLQRQLTEKEGDLEDKIHAYLALEHKNQEIEARNGSLEKDKARLENELMKARKELDKINNERDDLEKNNIERLRTMNEMNEVCQTMEKEIESLTHKVRQLTTDLEESELKLQVFDLKKVGKVVDTPAQILLRRNIAGENVIEMENAGERLVIYPQSIQSFGPHKETEDRFYIEYKAPDRHLQKDSFIAKDRKKVLRHLMNVVKYGKENRTPSSSKKNSVVEKNILSQVVSFFGN